MRSLLVIALLAAMSLAGCVGDDGSGADSGDGSQLTGSAEDEQLSEDLAVKPQARFEPVVSLVAQEYALEKGAEVDLDYFISDLDDYEFPQTFIDWSLFYEREANPVQEGDATQLPGHYNRSLFGNSWHMFALYVNDGQGFHDVQVSVVKTGEPTAPYPNATNIQDYINRVLFYYGEYTPPEGGVIEDTGEMVAVYETVEALDVDILTISNCPIEPCSEWSFFQSFSESNALPLPCQGLHQNKNGHGCAWVELLPGAAGTYFSVESDAPQLHDPDGFFLRSCTPYAPVIEMVASEGGEDGIIPEGAGCLVMYEFTGGVSTLSFHIDSFENPVSGHVPYTQDPVLTYALGPVAGCDHFVAFTYSAKQCAGMVQGPDWGNVEGHWIKLDPRYEGATVVGTNGGAAGEHHADSDCVFFDYWLDPIGDAHNGESPCTGTVPAGAHWIFVYPWVAPATSMDVSFALDPAKVSAAETTGKPVGLTALGGDDWEDRGWYYYDPVTGHCPVKSYSVQAVSPAGLGTTYTSALSGGTWILVERNSIPGLQIANSHPTAGQGAGFDVDVPGCEGGDTVVV